FSDPQRTDNRQRDDGFCWLRQGIVYTSNVPLCEYDGRLPSLLARQPDALRGIGRQQTPALP
ncbi:MAG: hypothetical protein WCA20_02850, partial [Candidatus Sulfotelmatobacter sp.]